MYIMVPILNFEAHGTYPNTYPNPHPNLCPKLHPKTYPNPKSFDDIFEVPCIHRILYSNYFSFLNFKAPGLKEFFNSFLQA